jgi:hypothetical protein
VIKKTDDQKNREEFVILVTFQPRIPKISHP